MDELTSWLRERLDQEERVIESNRGDHGLGDDGSFPDYRTYTDDDTDAADEYLRQFSPQHMAAEVAAKRAILDLHSPQPTGYVDGVYRHGEDGELQCQYCAELCHSRSGLGCDLPDAPWPCPTVRMLASAYNSEPGWREEWAADTHSDHG